MSLEDSEGCGNCLESYWDAVHFLRCWAKVSRDRFPAYFISDESCDNGLFTIQLVFVFWLFPRSRSQNTAKHCSLKILEKNCVEPLLHIDVLSSLATKPNLNRSKVNLCLLFPPLCVFISHPRNVVLLLCACVNRGCVRTWQMEAGGRRGSTVMSINEKHNKYRGHGTAARADPTSNPLQTCARGWIPGGHDRGQALGFQWAAGWWAVAAGCS